MSETRTPETDAADIARLLIAYTRALDAHDYEALGNCFALTATADYGTWGGFNNGREAIVRTCSVGQKLDATQHLLSNITITIDGDIAATESYVQALHGRHGAAGGTEFFVNGTYRDTLAWSAGEWSITTRQLVETWTHGNPRVLTELEEFDAAP